jgi:hypothetical protein
MISYAKERASSKNESTLLQKESMMPLEEGVFSKKPTPTLLLRTIAL